MAAESGFVALFIDWDNIAISTASDGGGPPDVKRIVQVAQSYGPVLTARAYAEWGITSDRLAVYRAGVEPVYAPTFRYEAEIPGQPPRGKSLADPCLVADCVDTLHLHPRVSTFVLVSGDKDLIPVVRLAQMRGKKVVVIGPDQVAAVLRDMADEYVPYRGIVTHAEPRVASVRAEVTELGLRRRRRGRGHGPLDVGGETAAPSTETTAEPTLAPQVEASPPPAAPRHERRERRGFMDRAGVFRARSTPAPVESESAPASGEPIDEAPIPAQPTTVMPEPTPIVTATPSAPAAPATPEHTRSPEDLFARISTILRERLHIGRPRMRATNLKDYLIAADAAFSEKAYGFATFRDALAAADRSGTIALAQEGSVQWITLGSATSGGAPATTPIVTATVPPPAAVLKPAEARVVPPTPPPTRLEVSDREAIAGLTALRDAGRLLTQGLVTSTLSSLLASHGLADGLEDATRGLFDHLVANGLMRVDHEPRDVEVNGTHHRLRLCEIVETAVNADAVSDDGCASSGVVAGDGPSAPAEAAEDSTPSSSPRGGARRRPRATEIPANVLDALVVAVGESIVPDRGTAGAAGVKSRLTRAISDFDEGNYGFSKFKDFLLAAEKAGRIRVEIAGAATRVGLPGGAQPA
ncbi:MAG: NYN domain-containing protein [Chloroflexota bacterium]|nr:MAG: NYN domain-containing protein [Chloroflexota bacterium]